MKTVLQFFKTHWLSLLSGTVAMAAIVFCVMGMTSDRVNKEMTKKLNEIGASGIPGLTAKPQNEATIASEKQRGKLFEEEYKKTVGVAKQINAREVLMPGVFPAAAKAATPFEFRQEYMKAVASLYKPMSGGMLPSEAEIQEEAQNIDDLRLLEEEKRAEIAAEDNPDGTAVASGGARSPIGGRGRTTFTPLGGSRTPAATGGSGRGLGTRGPSGGRGRGGGRSAGGMSGGGSTYAVGGDPKYDPVYRARVAKAKNILCYYSPTTFHVSPIALDETTSPPPEEMWFAQVSLWVQQDVVNAIKQLNQSAANEIKDIEPCVEQVPVKHLEAVRVLGYYASPNEEAPSGTIQFPATDFGTMMQGVNADASLTGRRSDDQFDVVRFVVSVVIDQRDILQFIDQISKVNFYQCISMRYDRVDPQTAQNEGYFYGTQPTVRATFVFEGYMSREVYEPLMPEPVRKLLGIAKSE